MSVVVHCRKAAAFMDIVDTFNHLIPSDQLDESLIVGQNLECEASNEFCPGIQLEDSLKNMLSDKDPMFGCSSAQFNLLDNEESAFQVAGMLSDDPHYKSISKCYIQDHRGVCPRVIL